MVILICGMQDIQVKTKIKEMKRVVVGGAGGGMYQMSEKVEICRDILTLHNLSDFTSKKLRRR